MKAATDKPDTKDKLGGISIHAAREGGDVADELIDTLSVTFQSTPPVKAATRPAIY